jgi:hypothetical protein
MRIVADESVNVPVIRNIRSAGFDVFAIVESDAGAGDERVSREANERAAPPLTFDGDFGELVFRRRLAAGGVMPVRMSGASMALKSIRVVEVLRDRGDRLSACFTVVTHAGYRLRRLP